MNISHAAKETGLSSKTIRFYEQEGIISPAGRAENGYRIYSSFHLEQLAFIKRARDLGFTLQESRELLQLAENHQRRSADVKAKVVLKLEWIEEQMQKLKLMRELLLSAVNSCPGDDSAECPILDTLSGSRIEDTDRSNN